MAVPAPGRLLSYLIIEASDQAFRGLADSTITTLLRSEDDSVRRAAALKCVRALPKKRVARILDSYTSGGRYRYYNVVHWLDLGVSAPDDRARAAAEKASNMKWRV